MEKSWNTAALIIGVTGTAGHSLAQALRKPDTPGSPLTVYGSSRRAPPVWFGPDTLDRFIWFDALDWDETARVLAEAATRVTHLVWVALAAREREDENIEANSALLMNVLEGLTSGGGSWLRNVAVQIGMKHYLGPDPVKMHRIGPPVEIPFHEDAPS